MPQKIVDQDRGALVSVYTLASTLRISYADAVALAQSGRLRTMETGVMTWVERDSMLEYMNSSEFKRSKEGKP